MRMEVKISIGYLVVAAVTTGVYGLMFWAADKLPELSVMQAGLIALSLVVAITFVAGRIWARSVTHDLNRLIRSARRISEGDLTQEVSLSRQKRFQDEIDDLMASVNAMLESLRELTARTQGTAINISQAAQNLSATSEEINASTVEIASTIEDISKGAELQAELVENTSKTVREMAGAIELTSSNAMVTSTSVSEAAHKAQSSGELANMAMEKMKQVFEKMANSQDMVVQFGEKTQRIGKIVEMITNIARQTNLLALNATIEAARAGEYGKGFAVVADEVRKLAESTSTSAEQITDLVQEIAKEAERVVSSMKETAQNISEGREDIGTINLSLEEIVEMVTEAADKVRNIAELSQVQAEGAKNLVTSIDEIAKVAHDNASSTEEVSAATEEQTASMQEMASSAQQLYMLSDELKKVVSRFRLDAERIIVQDSDASFAPGPEDRIEPAPVQAREHDMGEAKAGTPKKKAKTGTDDSDDMGFIFE
jgi:methyl-accepting chemotaxis protein